MGPHLVSSRTLLVLTLVLPRSPGACMDGGVEEQPSTDPPKRKTRFISVCGCGWHRHWSTGAFARVQPVSVLLPTTLPAYVSTISVACDDSSHPAHVDLVFSIVRVVIACLRILSITNGTIITFLHRWESHVWICTSAALRMVWADTVSLFTRCGWARMHRTRTGPRLGTLEL